MILQVSTPLKIVKQSSESRKSKYRIETDLKLISNQDNDCLPSKTKSSTRLKKLDQRIKLADNNATTFNKHRGSWEEIKETHFLDKVGLEAHNKSKPLSKSLGRRKERHENKVKILEPQYESSIRETPIPVNQKLKYAVHDTISKDPLKVKQSRISETDLSKYANMYVTADYSNQNAMGMRASRQSMISNNVDSNSILSWSTKGVNLPVISTKNATNPLPFVKGTPFDTRSLCKSALIIL